MTEWRNASHRRDELLPSSATWTKFLESDKLPPAPGKEKSAPAIASRNRTNPRNRLESMVRRHHHVAPPLALAGVANGAPHGFPRSQWDESAASWAGQPNEPKKPLGINDLAS